MSRRYQRYQFEEIAPLRTNRRLTGTSTMYNLVMTDSSGMCSDAVILAWVNGADLHSELAAHWLETTLGQMWFLNCQILTILRWLADMRLVLFCYLARPPPSSPPLWGLYRRWGPTLRSEENLPVGFHCTIVFWARRDILVLLLLIVFSFHCISRLRCCWVWSCTNTDCVGVLLFPSKFLCRAACAGGWCCRARSEVASAAGGDLGVITATQTIFVRFTILPGWWSWRGVNLMLLVRNWLKQIW